MTTDADIHTTSDCVTDTGVDVEKDPCINVVSDQEDEQEYMVQSIEEVGFDKHVSLVKFSDNLF